jgi:hypothetical protein
MTRCFTTAFLLYLAGAGGSLQVILSVCMYIRIYIYVYIYVYIYHIYTYAVQVILSVCMYIRIYIYVCTYIRIYMYIYNTCTYKYIIYRHVICIYKGALKEAKSFFSFFPSTGDVILEVGTLDKSQLKSRPHIVEAIYKQVSLSPSLSLSIYIHIYLHVYMYMYMYVCVCVCVCTCVCVCVCVCVVC